MLFRISTEEKGPTMAAHTIPTRKNNLITGVGGRYFLMAGVMG
jgi:hypothetical protein